MYAYYVGVGSNLGDREGYLQLAVNELKKAWHVQCVEHSRWQETPPWGPIAQGPFLNGLIKVITPLEPLLMIQWLLQIEKLAGRNRDIHWGPRTLDLDIVWIEDEHKRPLRVDHDTLQVPHPYFWERLFVLEPLGELYPEFIYHGETIDERIRTLKDQES